MIKNRFLKRLLYGKAIHRAFFSVWGLAIKEFRVSFKQFFVIYSPFWSFLRVLKYLFLSLNRLSFGKSARISYAFTAEDRLIEGLLKPKITEEGFYVEVGCNHPTFISNSFLFYRRGWRGICIDANTKLIAKYKYLRPRDKAIRAFVSNKQGEVNFIELNNDVLSSANSNYIKEMLLEEEQSIVSEQKIHTQTLTEILDACNCPKKFDFLSVDVEEEDYYVLLSLDFSKYQPRLVLVEDESFDMEHPESNLIYSYMKANGYTLVGYILTNLYFMKKYTHHYLVLCSSVFQEPKVGEAKGLGRGYFF